MQVEYFPLIWKAMREKLLKNTWFTEETPFMWIAFAGPRGQWKHFFHAGEHTGSDGEL